MKKQWKVDLQLFFVLAVAFYILMAYTDSLLLFISSEQVSQKIFKGYSNPLDISTLIGILALVPVVLQIIEDRGSKRARILAHKSKKTILSSAPLIAGISAAFEAQTAFRIFYDIEGNNFPKVWPDDPALLITSKWIPHFIFLLAIVSIPSMWESWLPESKKRYRWSSQH